LSAKFGANYEADLPAKQKKKKKQTRLQVAHVHRWWKARSCKTKKKRKKGFVGLILFFSFINKALSMFFIIIIKTYKATLSPFLGSNCRFDPTCSEYGLQAFRGHPPLRALSLVTKRIFRCHPFNAGGVDPIPKQ